MSLFPNIRKKELSDSSAFKSHPQSVGVGSLPRPTVLEPSRMWHGAGGYSLAGPTAPRPLGGTRSSALFYCPSLRPTVHLKEWVDFFSQLEIICSSLSMLQAGTLRMMA